MTPSTQVDADVIADALSPLKAAIGLLFLMLVGGAIAFTVVILSLRANDKAIVAARTEARFTECVRDNKRSETAVAQARTNAEVLIAAANRGRTPTDSENETALAYVAAQVDAAKKLYPQRECTPEAIADYYQTQAAAR